MRGCVAPPAVRWRLSHRAGRHQPRHLDEPARGILPQHRHEPFPLGFPAEPSQCLQEGQIGFPRPIVVQALAVPNPDVLGGRHLGHKRVDQGGLADAGLPRDDPHLPRALACRGPPLRQLGQGRVAPHKVRRATERGRRHAARGLLHPRPARSHQGADRRDEPIPPAVHRLDKAWGMRLIAQHPAQRAHGDRDDRLTHHRLGPDGLEQCVFGHELARLRHQAAEDRKGFWGAVGSPRGHATAVRRADRAGMAQRRDTAAPASFPLPVSARHCIRGPHNTIFRLSLEILHNFFRTVAHAGRYA